ncbi:hypothetical protein MHBO_002683 [Bonamia ostreae]|uniref:Protoheme IX farnesyltransferase, mitochondrial n=1 Tax=Bonamia ostreae TaxID=126728 RepID=A0ABV2AP33_9EUKA
MFSAFKRAFKKRVANSEHSFLKSDLSLKEISKMTSKLVKFNLSAFNGLSAAAGYLFCASSTTAGISPLVTGAVFIGTTLSAFSSSIGNQIIERDLDKKMIRTKNRPICKNEISPKTAFSIASTFLTFSFLFLGGFCGVPSFVASLVTAILYIAVYTPMKRITHLNTHFGALVGALPPIIGGLAAGFDVWHNSLYVSAFYYFWQIVHFYVISTRFKDDYLKAGFVMQINRNPNQAAFESDLSCLGMIAAPIFSVCMGAVKWPVLIPIFLIWKTFFSEYLQYKRNQTLKQYIEFSMMQYVSVSLFVSFFVLGKWFF